MFCECTDIAYSPAAMDIAPATRAANPAIAGTLLRLPFAAATPSTRLAVDRRPSLAALGLPQRNHPVACRARCQFDLADRHFSAPRKKVMDKPLILLG